MLFLVTCADLAAVGPDVLNSWKIEVLVGIALSRGSKAGGRWRRCADADRGVERNAVWELLTSTEQSDPWFERQLAALPESFCQQAASAE